MSEKIRENFWAHFLRLRRKKPGFAGLRFAPVFFWALPKKILNPSNPLRKDTLRAPPIRWFCDTAVRFSEPIKSEQNPLDSRALFLQHIP
jgi:hypothetical protein